MTTTSLDLSGKIDKVAVSALGRIHQISSSMNIPFFIVGATARDILLEVHYGTRGINTPVATSHAKLTDEQRAELGVTESLMRLSVGIEDVDDLVADIEKALT